MASCYFSNWGGFTPPNADALRKPKSRNIKTEFGTHHWANSLSGIWFLQSYPNFKFPNLHCNYQIIKGKKITLLRYKTKMEKMWIFPLWLQIRGLSKKKKKRLQIRGNLVILWATKLIFLKVWLTNQYYGNPMN